MNFPEFGVKNPVANLMIFFSIIVLAGYSLTRIGVDQMPEIEPPMITVISGYPGASAEDVEVKVTEELENQLGTTPGLEKITSSSSEGYSAVNLKFIWGTNLDAASNDIRDRIELAKRVLPDIPDEMDNPFLFKFNTANIPILFVGITAKQTYPRLYDLMDTLVGDKLRQLPGVGAVLFQGGGLERQINIWLDRQRLEGYRFSILDVQNALREENITQPLGSLKSGLSEYAIRLPGEFASPDEINTVILGRRAGKLVYLKDVARVEDSFKEVTSLVRINKQPGLMMIVQKQSGTNTVEVAQRVKQKMRELEKSLPADVKRTIIFDNSRDIIDSLNSLKSSLWLAVMLVMLVVWFFLRRFAPSMIIALTIPFSLLITFIYLFLGKRTINSVSLSSVAIASGMVVDNAIVVVDNVFRRLERGNRPQEAAIFGTSEMSLAITASTFTTVVVFLPMLFVRGVIGIIFGELAMVVTVTLLASLFTAITFSPMLCAKWLKASPTSSLQPLQKGLFRRFYALSERLFRGWEDFYGMALEWSLRHKRMVLAACSLVLAASFLLTRLVGNEFMPEEDTGDMRINVQLAIGTRVEESDKIARRIEAILESEVPEKVFYYVRSGQLSGVGRSMGQASGSHIISAGAKLVPKTARGRSVWEAAQAVRRRIRSIPGVLKTDISTGNPIGRLITGMGGKAVQVEIIGHSFSQTDALAEKIKALMERLDGAVDVAVSRELKRPELRVEIDRVKAASLGLDMNIIASTLKTFIQGSTASKYREKGRTYDIYVRLEENSRQSIEDIESLPIIVPLPEENAVFAPAEEAAASAGIKRQQVRLGNIARIYETQGPQTIERLNRERVVRVECNAYKRSAGKIIEDLRREFRRMVVPSDIMINFGAEAEEQKKAFKDLGLLLALGVCLVYMVMAAQFGSLLDPFVIMFSIPFTFVGVVLGFVFTGTTLSIITYLGMVMLMGIVVNNAIVLVSYINILRARGLGLSQAITAGGKERLRPVLMTTVTTLAGLLPLALSRGEGSEVWQPLGITMISGLSLSTAVTLILVPVVYAVFETKVRNGGSKR